MTAAGNVKVYHGDALAALRTLPDSSIDAVVTDPPYGLAHHKPAAVITALTAWVNGDRERVPDGHGFMGRKWDAFVPPPAVWDECLRVLKPGGHLLCFAGTRTVDLMGLSIRLAGFEIRDSIGNAMMAWVHGQGFPKGKNQLKPAWEPILLCRKPLVGMMAANVLEHGTGGINVDACRVNYQSESDRASARPQGTPTSRAGALAGKEQVKQCVIQSGGDPASSTTAATTVLSTTSTEKPESAALAMSTRTTFHPTEAAGRWPTNVVLSHGPECQPGCPVDELDAQSGTLTSGPSKRGGASRFFPTFKYQAKAPTKERPKIDGKSHCTVKPLALMRWLVKLVTPPGGTVLDPFAGSGTTGQAAELEGFSAILVEDDAHSVELIRKRLSSYR
jgi:site-specific DNA-methyltransferase (adenine-specific)